MFSKSEGFLLMNFDFGLKITHLVIRISMRLKDKLIPLQSLHLYSQLIQSQTLKVIHHDPAISIKLYLLIIYKTGDSDVLSYVNGTALCDHYKSTVGLPQLKLQLQDSG
jgi:hypothetical protein